MFIKKLVGRLRRSFQSFGSFCSFLREKQVDGKTIVLISHNGDSAGGASVVLFELAVLLQQRGYRVLFLSHGPGDLLDACKASGISGFLTGGFRCIYLRRLAKEKPMCFLANTAVCHESVRFLQECGVKAPVFWWLHEENGILEANRNAFSCIAPDKVQVLCVSQRVKAALERICPGFARTAALFPYGCRDLYQPQPKKPRDTFVILSVGRLCARKNQLQLVEAVEKLPQKVRNKLCVEFVFGSSEPDYEGRLRRAVQGRDYYKLMGRVSRERIPALYADADLLVSTSLDDPLPVVVTEAMMLHCPVIISSGTGHYPLICDGENGWRYSAWDTAQLCSRILEAVQTTQTAAIIAAARNCYEQCFSLSALEENFLRLLEEIP